VSATARLRVAVVDDEPDARARVLGLLADHENVTVVAECRDGAEAAETLGALLARDGLDLLFLDVQMPELDGFEVLAALAEQVGSDKLPAVVFVTAFDDYAMRAFDVSAVDYLLKPFDRDRFERALARGSTRASGGAPALHALLAHLRDAPAERGRYARRLIVRADGRLFPIRVEEVTRLDVDGNYVRLHTRAGAYQVRDTLSAVEARLDPALFVRVHRSAIVQVDCIASLEPYFHGEYVITMRDGAKLTASRSYATRLRALLG
jgi:two-component system, LytTR family, response regulator